MNTIERIQKQILDGNEPKISSLLDKLESKKTLPAELQLIVDDLKNTPNEEPERYKTIQNKDQDGLLPIFSDLLDREQAKKYSAIEIGDFIHTIIEKITSHKDEDGNFKTTPNTAECDMPDVYAIEDMLKLVNTSEDARQKMLDSKAKDKSKLLKKYTNILEETDKKMYEASGLDKEKLSEWEQLLVTKMTYETIKGYKSHAQGKQYLG